MLKIKDNVDLEELEKFGFEFEFEDGEEWYAKYFDNLGTKIFVFSTGEIVQGEFVIIYGFKKVELNEKLISDLIQAGIVEKVNE